MKLLVIGSGGREHAIARTFLKSPEVETVYVAPGNPGMALDDGIVPVAISESEHEGLMAFAREADVTFTFVGPEVPLLAGIVDNFQAQKLKIFGPTRAAAMIEGSKEFAKQLMADCQVPTARYEAFTDYQAAVDYVHEHGAPIVIKADGLAAGKGVVVAMTLTQAEEALQEMLQNQRFGTSGARVVIEEFLEGEEFSLLSFVSDNKVYPMIPAQDHKAAFDGDLGPNTGGMGAYAPVPHLSQEVVDQVVREIVEPVAQGMVERGIPFTGILYTGLIVTAQGPKVIEFNARFGDPETQVILPRLVSDFAHIILDILDDKNPTIDWDTDGVTLGVVLAAKGYPNQYETGMSVPKLNDLSVLYAGVSENAHGQLLASGGRVLLVEQSACSVTEASQQLYNKLNQVNLHKLNYRNDIGWRAITKEKEAL
jgi:phosphoribosylamine--glycine ligase